MTGGELRLTPADTLLVPPGVDGSGLAAPYPGVAAALAARLRTDGASPMVTFYDDATGERVELSGATLDNWVAKTANLLVDTLGLGPGDRVGVDLPAHWLTVVVLLAAWSAGLDVLVGTEAAADEPAGATDEPAGDLAALFVAESRIEAALALGADEVIALSLRPLGARMTHPVAGVLDFATEVPAHGDRFAAPRPPAAQTALLAHAALAAVTAGLGPDDRLLATAGPASAQGLLSAVLGPLVTGASVVLCRHLDGNLDDAALARRIATERVTAVCGTARPVPAGVRRLRFDAAAES
ncbi:TIGR03089 family protein [Frankia sp. CNm7]|uniref:TIGR03089 family protein n=1 Tax=Frankia nepalensis TaxID=1836974 RepID=A0A937UWQ2_9ACTN|nr:TIGR03089 family protein [Frankia nepalensis]MBL7496821.1 TIGR03089 family protein [Frankia nepalensis]MBL7510968.1 TIGR03089 family protein [Frankia nepalensis]MBL7519666.1 TIGR03089 family protein [Frankia nepalensis]MBL7633631.1 TIGR03089 family protein [Frankia nepalensis]